MKRRFFSSLGLLAFCAAQIAILLYLPPSLFPGDSRNSGVLSWHTYSSIIHNAYFQLPSLRHLDPTAIGNCEIAIWGSLSFLFCLISLLILVPSHECGVSLAAAAISIAPQAMFGPDIFLMRLVTFASFTVMILELRSQKFLNDNGLIVSICSVALLCFCYLGLFAELPFFVAAIICSITRQSSAFSTTNRIVFFSLTVVLTASSLLLPWTPFPKYPEQARISSFTSSIWFQRPLIGPDTPIPTIERSTVLWFGMYLGKILSILSLLLYLVTYKKYYSRCFQLAGLIAVCVLLDTFLPVGFAQISPIASLSRMIPGLELYPLTALCSVFSISLLLLGSVLTGTAMLFLPAVIACLTLIACIRNAPIIVKSRMVTWANAYKSNVSVNDKKILTSPSFSVINAFTPGLALHPDLVMKAKFKLLDKDKVVISASSDTNLELFERMFDKFPGTRWTPGTGKQTGKEWIHISLPSNQLLRGVSLSPGNFETDFPRALRISASATCPTLQPYTQDQASQYSVVANYFPWQGSLLFSDDGYPYFTGQEVVRVVFPEAVYARCLLIEQTGIEPHYDWSIAELRLAFE